jgi:hypothetical protein
VAKVKILLLKKEIQLIQGKLIWPYVIVVKSFLKYVTWTSYFFFGHLFQLQFPEILSMVLEDDILVS